MVKKVRKLPLRMCVGCQEKKNKRDLVRIVRTPEKEIRVDQTGKTAGRGVYICPHITCLETAVKKKRLERSLQQPVSLDVLEELKESLTKDE